MTKRGELFILATPIGNLQDITLRVLEILKQVDLIAVEDKRHSGKLLQHYDIKKPLFILHDHNEIKCAQLLCQKLQQGKSIALISDAGSPLISDPGYHLLKTVIAHGFQIIPIPGACAAIAALSVAGLPTDKFVFEGFLPAKSQQQLKYLQKLTTETRTMIFYEAPHRLLKSIDHMILAFGANRHAVIAKELTKMFEMVYRDTLLAVKNWLLTEPQRQKGEFVILIKGAAEPTINPEVVRILKLLAKHLPAKQAVVLTAQITGVKKNQLYQLFLDL